MAIGLLVATPEGRSGDILSGPGDYLFRYHHDAPAHAAISLLMPLRVDDYRHRPAWAGLKKAARCPIVQLRQ